MNLPKYYENHPLLYDRGRGTEFIDIRITINDLWPYLQEPELFPDERIAELLSLTLEQVAAGKAYIAENYEEVKRINDAVDARHAKGNSPEVLARLAGSHERLMLYKAFIDYELSQGVRKKTSWEETKKRFDAWKESQAQLKLVDVP